VHHLTLFITLLQDLFGWNLARAKCGAAIIVGLIKVRTVNLTELATAVPVMPRSILSINASNDF